jgi:hypothetical protein
MQNDAARVKNIVHRTVKFGVNGASITNPRALLHTTWSQEVGTVTQENRIGVGGV